MKYLVVFLVFVMGAITMVEALNCLKCKEVGKRDCRGESVECVHKDDFCTKKIEYNQLDKDLITTVARGCSNISEACHNTVDYTSVNYAVVTHNECCYTDNCNNGKITMPKLNTNENGYMCPACFVAGKNYCDKEIITIPCNQNQRDCYVFFGLGARPGEKLKNYYISGCMTSDACIYGPKTLVGTRVAKPSNITCSPAQRTHNSHNRYY
uniref:Sodefrin-like factor B n=1 Tax=Boana cinerascens TaxID=2364978 RepID=A0A513ZV70_9NEOB|nr:sodefrin precursor-like factor B [Boana cinerascens]